ncbi:MAG: hypothetical protein IPK72_21420 [Candidatus Eisenbacteria bacterium]|nr:hypothetical protein [Candidatus Eisenbacteria bacterium]
MQSSGGRLFVERRPAGANNFMLFVRDELGGEERLLFDPETRTEEIHHALNYWVPSPDPESGWRSAFRPRAARTLTSRSLEVDTGRFLPEVIDRCQYAFPAWLPDSRGFFYIQLAPGRERGSVEYYRDISSSAGCIDWAPIPRPTSRLSRTGDVPGGSGPARSRRPRSRHTGDGVRGCRGEHRGAAGACALPQHGWPTSAGRKAGARSAGVEDAVTGFVSRGHEIFLLSHRDAPHFQVLRG